MDLFNQNRINNLLHKDGTVNYYPNVLTNNESSRYFDLLLQKIVWENDEAIIFGKHIVTKRKVAWYGDSDYLYTYSNTTKQAFAWTEELLDLREIVQKLTETKF
ncbi:MAG: hypothetical protein WA667_00415, partial [Candidatus Nitrosopolaris sp.]